MKLLITGINGFIGKNVFTYFSENKDIDLLTYSHNQTDEVLASLLLSCDFIIHLAGVNRPESTEEFKTGNVDLTTKLCGILSENKLSIPVIFASSTQALQNNVYGESKQAAEYALLDYSAKQSAPIFIFRLPNVFGKWAKPNYNSAVATFCHNIVNDLPIQINDGSASVTLTYIDDVILQFEAIVQGDYSAMPFVPVKNQYKITVSELADKINSFKSERANLMISKVGTGLDRALYATYISYLKPDQFSYKLTKHTDNRGSFVEMLKTTNSGQFSFFTAYPGITRGGHYHHTKTEKFLVVHGKALFKFRNVITNEYFELETNSETPEVVDTIPGWIHDITNCGAEIMIVMLWANEVFNPLYPDTYNRSLKNE